VLLRLAVGIRVISAPWFMIDILKSMSGACNYCPDVLYEVKESLVSLFFLSLLDWTLPIGGTHSHSTHTLRRMSLHVLKRYRLTLGKHSRTSLQILAPRKSSLVDSCTRWWSLIPAIKRLTKLDMWLGAEHPGDIPCMARVTPISSFRTLLPMVCLGKAMLATRCTA